MDERGCIITGSVDDCTQILRSREGAFSGHRGFPNIHSAKTAGARWHKIYRLAIRCHGGLRLPLARVDRRAKVAGTRPLVANLLWPIQITAAHTIVRVAHSVQQVKAIGGYTLRSLVVACPNRRTESHPRLPFLCLTLGIVQILLGSTKGTHRFFIPRPGHRENQCPIVCRDGSHIGRGFFALFVPDLK